MKSIRAFQRQDIDNSRRHRKEIVRFCSFCLANFTLFISHVKSRWNLLIYQIYQVLFVIKRCFQVLKMKCAPLHQSIASPPTFQSIFNLPWGDTAAAVNLSLKVYSHLKKSCLRKLGYWICKIIEKYCQNCQNMISCQSTFVYSKCQNSTKFKDDRYLSLKLPRKVKSLFSWN